ncbi:hypothetical protein RM572_22910 [Streptomyces sp. DSM 42041]|uniref:Uncharacterized protein n=1 Tax=Streptomyces hazeniae TaxID=3075538 RepID=A0ABU2NX95_9ACTN|nr:hypothetical protein [Streptomyces sp. DSM 42041]MDT0381615.1 hypothetical protein [Streptomyces sp. DSM 42041]
MQYTLNKTICQHVRMVAVQRPFFAGPPVFTIGSGLSRSNPTQPTGFPLGIDNKKPRVWMSLSYQVRMDDEQCYLAVHSSYCGIFAEADLSTCLCHFDFEREKEHYAGAHLQVHGSSPALDKLNRGHDVGRTLDKLHFPVGGKRFRPSLEDVIEFLVSERLVDAREGWEQVVEDGRDQFQRQQLKAAMRRNTAVVQAWVRDHGQAMVRE